MRFTYRLDFEPASWDFMVWLIVARMAADCFSADKLEVNFIGRVEDRPDDMSRPMDQRRAIFENVIRPAVCLVGATEVVTDELGEYAPYFMRIVVEQHKRGLTIPRFIIPPDHAAKVMGYLNGRKPVVVTLREADYYPERNSNLEAWKAWAAECGEDVIFVRDTCKADEPFDGFETCPQASRDVLFRAALMDAAKANMFIGNGPSVLAIFGNRPFAFVKPLVPNLPTYKPGQIHWWRKKVGVDYGKQFPWSRADQRIIWEADNLEGIRRGWEAISQASKLIMPPVARYQSGERVLIG